MQFAGALAGDATAAVRRFRIGESLSAGQIVVSGSTGGGEVEDPTSVTDFSDAVGLALTDATYSTTQGDDEGTVQVALASSNTLYKGRVNPGATSGTQLADADGVVLTNTSASAGGTTITDSDVGSATRAQGTVIGISGANRGESRIVTTFNSGTSLVVSVPFPNAIAVGDMFVVVPYKVGANQTLQLTTDFTEINASVAVGTGDGVVVDKIEVHTEDPYSVDNPEIYVYFRIADSVFSEDT